MQVEITIWLYTLISVLAVGLISLVGLAVLSVDKERLSRSVSVLVSLAVGTLLGGAFVHLLPEAYEALEAMTASILVLGGIIGFFVLEKFLHWHHRHNTANHVHPVGYINLAADAIHNFIDGVLVAAAYIVSLPLGVATTIAVIAHEIPQEIGDFGVLIHAGFTRTKALLFNFFSAMLAVVGALAVLTLSQKVTDLAVYMIPLAAGGLIYIAGSDLLPEISRERSQRKSFIQLTAILTGIILMIGAGYLE